MLSHDLQWFFTKKRVGNIHEDLPTEMSQKLVNRCAQLSDLFSDSAQTPDQVFWLSMETESGTLTTRVAFKVVHRGVASIRTALLI